MYRRRHLFCEWGWMQLTQPLEDVRRQLVALLTAQFGVIFVIHWKLEEQKSLVSTTCVRMPYTDKDNYSSPMSKWWLPLNALVTCYKILSEAIVEHWCEIGNWCSVCRWTSNDKHVKQPFSHAHFRL